MMNCEWKQLLFCGVVLNLVFNTGYCEFICETTDDCYGSTEFTQFFHEIYFDPNSPQYHPEYICENSNPLKVWCDDKLKSKIQDGAICGQAISEEINLGPRTKINEFPWMALLQYTDGKTIEASCQGVLITNEWVMTSATCISRNTNGFNLTSVRLGEWDKSTVIDCDNSSGVSICNNPPVVVPIEQTVINQKFLKSGEHYDNTGIIRLKHKVEYTEFIKPICLPTFINYALKREFYPGKEFEIASWGEISAAGNKNEFQLKARFEAIACPSDSGDSWLCIPSTRKRNVCEGDEGAPIMGRTTLGNRTFFYLAGIVSHRNSCGPNEGPIFIGDRVDYRF